MEAVQTELEAQVEAAEGAAEELRSQLAQARADFEQVLEQTERELGEDDEEFAEQMHLLQQKHVDGLQSQLHIATRCARWPVMHCFCVLRTLEVWQWK